MKKFKCYFENYDCPYLNERYCVLPERQIQNSQCLSYKSSLNFRELAGAQNVIPLNPKRMDDFMTKVAILELFEEAQGLRIPTSRLSGLDEKLEDD